jgi:putative peptidoglycan lipid II flippase
MSKFFKHSAIVSIMTFISRILGLLRDIMIATIFGVSGVLDAFLVAFKIPNFGRRLFAEGSFSQAVMPTLAQAKVEHNEQEVINHITGRLFIILFIITLIVVIFSPIFVFIFAPSFYFDDIDKFNLTANLLKITFPYLLFISLTAFFGSILNNNSKFAIPAFTPVLLNLSLIVCGVFLAPYLSQPIYALAIGVFIGGVLQLLLQLPFLAKIKRLPRPSNKPHPVLKTIKTRMLPALFSTSISQINMLIDVIVATSLTVGSVSWLYYANRLLELPVALVGVALGIVGIASLSSAFARNDNQEFHKILSQNINLALLLGIPAAVGLVALSQELISTLFYYGNFELIDVINSAKALSIYGLALIFFIVVKIITPAFLARGDTKTPVKVAFVAMLVNIILNIILAYYFGFLGIAIATFIAAITNTIGLIWQLNKQQIFDFKQYNLQLLGKIIIGSILMLVSLNLFDFNFLALELGGRISYLLLEVGLAIFVYFVVLFILKVKIKSV